MERITDKLHFARMSNEEVVESTLPNSVRRDGITKFRRVDLIEVLIFERNQLRHLLKLHFIDQELHEANRTSKDHIESFALHGYRTFLWTKDAQVALEREHNRLVARLVATEIADDILEWMLEGWHFGQRRSQHKVVGNVPSIKKTGPIKAGVDVKVSIHDVIVKLHRINIPLPPKATWQYLSQYTCMRVVGFSRELVMNR